MERLHLPLETRFYECKHVAFGLTSPPATFHQLMAHCMGESLIFLIIL